MAKSGLKTARSPGSISNAEHHDDSGSKKVIAGTALTIKSIIAASTTNTAVDNYTTVLATNTAGTTAFIWSGKESNDPGIPSITTGIAIPPNTQIALFLGETDDPKDSITVKTSAATVQLAILGS